MLCGPQPSLSELERMIVKHWRSSLSLLTSLSRSHPVSGNIDRSILGYVLVNTDKKRVLSMMSPQQKDSRSLSLPRRLDICRTFYRTVVGAVLPSSATPSPHVLELGGTLLPDHSPHTKVEYMSHYKIQINMYLYYSASTQCLKYSPVLSTTNAWQYSLDHTNYLPSSSLLYPIIP